MIYRIILILCLILSSCKKEKDEEGKAYDITINGVVTDQVTGQPVEGAQVSLGRQFADRPEEGLIEPIQSTLTGPEGSYELITQSVTYEPHGSVSLGEYQRQIIALIAGKSGYIGSDRVEMRYYGAENSVINIQLFHSSELDLHIKNDTTNSINAVSVKLIKSPNYIPVTVLTLVCNTRNLDSTYVIKNLFGNMDYSILVLKPDGEPFSPQIGFSITPAADAINNFAISY